MKILFILFIFSSQLFAEDFTFDKEKGYAVPNYIGELKILKGKVYKQSQGKTSEVRAGTRFVKSDTIIVTNKSFAKILIVDDTVLSLGPNSELNFSEFDFKNKDERSLVYTFIKGQLAAHVKKEVKAGQVQFKTKTAVMAIRGTSILINHQTSKNLEISEFALLSGAAIVSDDLNPDHQIKKGEHIVIVKDSSKKQTGHEKSTVAPDELKKLEAIDVNEDKDFKPFLPYFDLGKLIVSSPLKPFFQTASAESDVEHVDDSGARAEEAENKGWEHNLKRLNDQLKEDQ